MDDAPRGTAWVVAQFALMAVAVVAGFVPPDWPGAEQTALSVAGAVLAVAGLAFAVWAGRTLGRALTPFPRPVPAGLVTTGPFAVVRHPIYTGGLAFFLGYAFLAGPLALVPTLCLALLWLGKIRVEERHLLRTYPAYEAYRRRVRRRLIPFVV